MKILKVLLIICLITATVESKAQFRAGIEIFPEADSLKKCIGQRLQIISAIYNTEYFPDYGVTILYVGNKSPNQILALIIRDEDRKKFKPNPNIYYRDREVKITGILESNNGKLEIAIKDPSQIAVAVQVRVNR